jgi:hypothetical protein
MSADAEPQVRSSAWMDEVEAALRHLKNANDMPRSQGGDQYDRREVCDTICHLQEIVDAERRPSSIAKSSDGGRAE